MGVVCKEQLGGEEREKNGGTGWGQCMYDLCALLLRRLDFSLLANDRITFSLCNDHSGSDMEDGLNWCKTGEKESSKQIIVMKVKASHTQAQCGQRGAVVNIGTLFFSPKPHSSFILETAPFLWRIILTCTPAIWFPWVVAIFLYGI